MGKDLITSLPVMPGVSGEQRTELCVENPEYYNFYQIEKSFDQQCLHGWSRFF